MPRSEITTLLPRPRSVSGRSRDRAKRMSARSSKPLCAVARRSAGPPTRIVVSFASGASRSALTPDAPRDVAARGRRGRAAPVASRHAAGPGARAASCGHGVARRGAAAARRGRAGSRRPRPPRRAGPWTAPPRPSRRAATGRRGCATASTQGLGVERLVLDQLRRAGVDELRGVRPLVRAGVRVRHDDERQPERGDLGERRRAGAADDEVGRRQRLEQPLAQERLGPVARPQSPPAASLARASAPAQALRPGDVDHDGRARRAAAAPPATASLNRRTACEPPKITTQPRVRPGCRGAPARRGDRPPRRRGSACRSRSSDCPAGQGRAGRPEADGERRGQPRRRADAPAGDDVALPQERRDPEEPRGDEHRDRDVPAGREDRRGPPPEQPPQRLRARTARAGSGPGRGGCPVRRTGASGAGAAAAGCPTAGTSRPSSPRRPPTQSSSGASGRRRSELATASAG